MKTTFKTNYETTDKKTNSSKEKIFAENQEDDCKENIFDENQEIYKKKIFPKNQKENRHSQIINSCLKLRT